MPHGPQVLAIALVCGAIALSGCAQNNAPLVHASTPATTPVTPPAPSSGAPPTASPTTSNSSAPPPTDANATAAASPNATGPAPVNVTTEADYVAGGGVLSPHVPDDCLDTARERERTSTPIVAQKDQGGVCWSIPNGTRTLAAQANDYVKYDVRATADFLDASGKKLASAPFCTHLDRLSVPAAARTLIILVGKGDLPSCPPGLGASGPIVVAFR